jgi:hypothetical protein
MTRLVFLHIPKTAGQTVHSELARIMGAAAVSPVRVHTQATTDAQFPAGYRLYSGHLDWIGLDAVARPRFVFTVLRDPRERIASFYFFLLSQARELDAEALSKPENTGKRMLLDRSADDYFFAGDDGWKTFIRDHYDNFYCSYFATRRMRGWKEAAQLDEQALIDRATQGALAIDAIYSTAGLPALERDIAARTGQTVQIAERYVNAGPGPRGALRWPELLARFESDDARHRIEDFARRDDRLIARLALDGRITSSPFAP